MSDEDVLDRFVAVAHEIVWCTLATVDRRNRPRSRVVHPLWEHDGDGLVGWVGSRPTPLRLAHIEHSPYVSCSYWHPRHDIAVAECAAGWVPDLAQRRAAWERFLAAPAPVGYDPNTAWPGGPDADDFAVLRLDAWRVRVATGEEMAAGTKPHVWSGTASAP